MKTRLLISTLVLGSALTLASTPARAAEFPPDELKVNVPFRFVVGESVLPAGRYTVHPGDVDGAVVWFVSPNGHHVAVTATQWGGPSFEGNSAHLRFRVYGTTHFLSSIQIPGEASRFLPLPRSNVENELARLAEQRASRRSSAD